MLPPSFFLLQLAQPGKLSHLPLWELFLNLLKKPYLDGCAMETRVLLTIETLPRPSKFHDKNNTHSGDKQSEGIHFK